jgi:hypothetical protein
MKKGIFEIYNDKKPKTHLLYLKIHILYSPFYLFPTNDFTENAKKFYDIALYFCQL